MPEIKRFTFEQFEFLDEQLKSRKIRPEDFYLDDELVSRNIAVEEREKMLEEMAAKARTFTGKTERPDGLREVESDRFRILHVPKKCTIKQFVLSNSLEFKCGRGFYEFTKPEIVSHKKEVVQMFASSKYCQLIPAQTTAKTNLRPRWWLLRRVQVPCSRGKMPAGLLEVKLYDTIKIYLL